MTLYKRTLLITSIVVAVMLLFMYGASQIVLMGSFDKLDEQYSMENVEIARDALNETLNKLDSSTGDWAVWDDVYFYVIGSNEDFVNSYLNTDTNANLKMNLMVYMNLSGKLVGSVAFDLKNQTEVPAPRYFSELSDSDVLLQYHGVGSTIKGIILLPEGPMLLSSWPVTNGGKFPVGGTIIMGHYLDESEIDRLSKITHLPLTIHRIDEAQMPSDVNTSLSFLSKDNPVFIRQLSDKSIAGYVLLNDIYGNPAIIMKVETLRAVHEQGKETMEYFILLLVIIGIIFVVVFLFLLKNFVLSRLANLDAQVQGISRKGDNSLRVSIEKAVKLSNGHRTINRMVDSLTLRNKTLLIMGVVFLIIIILLLTASQIILMERFTGLEEQYSHQKTQFSLDTLNDDLNKLKIIEWDWAAWDDTYNFINDSNEEFIRSNLRLEIFTNIRVNLMLFIDSSGNIVYGKAFDLENQTEVPVPGYFKEKLSTDDYLLQHFDTESNKTGILLIPEGPMLVASHPILQNDRSGPIRGTLIIGRFLNSEEIKRISGITHLPLSIHRFDDKQMPSDFQASLPFISKDKPIHIMPESPELIAGYALIDDIYGKPGVILKVEVPRGIYEQGKETLRYFIFSLLIICLVFSIMIMALLEIFVLRRLNRIDSEVKNIQKNGTTSSRVIIEGKDEISNLAGSLNNMLDALEQSQENVSKSEAKNRAILEAIPDSILQIRKDGTIFNYKAAKDRHHIALSQESIGRNIRDVMPQNLAMQIMDHIQKTLLTKENQIFQYQLMENSNICYYEARTVVFGEEDILAIITDITERRRADEALTSSLSLLNATLESTADGILVVDRNGRITRWNQKFADMWQIPEDVLSTHSDEQALNHVLHQLIQPETFLAKVRELYGHPEASSVDQLNLNGGRIFERYSMPQRIGDEIVGRVWSFRDITERKLAEAKIKASLDEKETLLKEIHHRVKNNMQIVSSLLDHQTQHIKDKNVISIFTESQNRIASMALIHEKLYQSKDLAKIGFYDYINDLVANLFQSYVENPGKIRLNMKIEEIHLDIDLAIPCGLIINELVTNSLKYAFPEGRKGEIKILFHKLDEYMIELIIGDNGIGLPLDLDFRKTNSLGLHLVTILAENQLHGEINLNRNGGIEFQIKFRGIK